MTGNAPKLQAKRAVRRPPLPSVVVVYLRIVKEFAGGSGLIRPGERDDARLAARRRLMPHLRPTTPAPLLSDDLCPVAVVVVAVRPRTPAAVKVVLLEHTT